MEKNSEIYIVHYVKTIFDEDGKEFRQIISFVGDFAYTNISLAYKEACDYIINQGWSEIFSFSEEEDLFWEKFFMYYEKEFHYEKAYEMINLKFYDIDDFPKIEKFQLKLNKQ